MNSPIAAKLRIATHRDVIRVRVAVYFLSLLLMLSIGLNLWAVAVAMRAHDRVVQAEAEVEGAREAAEKAVMGL